MNYYLITLVSYTISVLSVRFLELNANYLAVGLSLATYLIISNFLLKIKKFPTSAVVLAVFLTLNLSNYSNLGLVFCTVLLSALSVASIYKFWDK